MLGVLWWIVLYMGIMIAAGGIVGAIAGSREPGHAQDAGRRAGEAFDTRYGGPILIGSMIVTFAGAGFGLLPGTVAGIESERRWPGRGGGHVSINGWTSRASSR